MALNQFMHPRNIYRTPPDFKELVNDYPEVRPFMTTDIAGKTKYDFQNPDALRVLTETLLKKDFQLDVQIPAGKLVPTLPNRLNYLLWLEDVVGALQLPDDQTVTGLDVGTGACAVYALLGSRRGWHMIGTERDPDSLEAARRNVQKNGLDNQVKVLEADGTLLTGPLRAAGPVHFTLCNPPFFDSDPADPEAPAPRRPPPPAASTGVLHEVSCPGGERAFVTQMIKESAALADRCRVFTTMLGHKSSVRPMKKAAYEAGAKEAIATELCQGWTKRWAIGWTFEEGLNLRENVKPTKQTKKRAPVQCVVPRDLDGIQYNVTEVKQHVVEWLQELKLEVEAGNCNKYYASYKVTAWEDTWTHRRRRLREERRAAAAAAGSTSDLAPSPASADLALSPQRAADTSAASDTSDLSCRTDDTDPAAGKRSRCDSGEPSAGAGAPPSAKRPCLESALGAVTLNERRRAPALVFTLFVQKRGPDILLMLQLFKGELGSEGVNGVLLFLKRKLESRLAVHTTTGGSGGGEGGAGTGLGGGESSEGQTVQDAAAQAAAAPVKTVSVSEGVSRAFNRLRTHMKQRLNLSPADSAGKTQQSASGRSESHVASGQPESEVGASKQDPAAAGEGST
ncbi:RNA N6-adenosine-methyltransferase mettl16-like [Amphibalanus amphitrite]|uniref:RNA N6-adenosine-methyltransferase mettl16-like n=1 Tax=Amphibalanus amphitrite TaxID=1232801 RepID=UPI001C9270FA|nr:RNA N6-adenosine-methyltransferase mettl16-like [Amphibalanus amphitrite]XP_043194381.1 RNA N6-adenosine-methyltransferase mettl16-like [Amphibalanus amphitrite]XP_043194383.1 RNA N6-adenosine-methyltransferase mettl16-like [Amphibalanus amphitrite]